MSARPSSSAVARDGSVTDEQIRARLHLLGHQVVEFAQAQAGC
jgi:hypothetical protein